jgi:tetratricopeptide (TPR) repeat protein
VCFSCGRHLTALTQGAVIASRYEIVGMLGKGGMGMVYRANDQLLDEVVAIKVLRNELMGAQGMAERFRSEIKLARKVSHPNVCRIHEYGQDGGVSYISMALIEGTNLRKLLLLHTEGLPRDQAFQVAIQVAEGLQAIHDVGIIHRDLKTANVAVESSGQVRLMDFGIAKESSGAGSLTATGEVMGTPEYMSPEQCRGQSLDFKSDIYSLGILIYEVFTGHVPFRGDSVTATLLKQMEDPPPLDGPDAVSIPPGVVTLLRKALAKDATQRPVSAGEVAQALRQARQGPEAKPRVDELVTASPHDPSQERRQHSRLGISVDVILQRISAGGAVLQEERTVADNIGRKGARIMTAMAGLTVGDSLVLREVGGGFQARAAVRHVFKPDDRIQRLGLEFLDGSAPDRLVPTDAETQRGTPRATPRASAAQPAREERSEAPTAPPAAPATGSERRRGSRLAITMDVILRRLGPGGETLQEERSVADNVSREGARLMTAMTTLAPGDIVFVEEVGSNFRTRATVRSSHTGKDNIHRLGIEFIDQMAPDRLVATGDSKPRLPRPRAERPADPPAPPANGGPDADRLRERRQQIQEAYAGLKTRNHFEVLGLPRASNAAQVKDAYVRLARQYHPDARNEPGLADLQREAEAVFHAITAAHEVLLDPIRRGDYETRLGPSRRTPPSVPVASAPVVMAPTPQPVRELEREFERAPAQQQPADDPGPTIQLADQILKDARKLVAEGKYFDAIQRLEGATALAKGSKTNHAVRLLLAQAIAKNPKWQKRAETILLSLVEENPGLVEAHVVLGTLYRASGMNGRAESAFRRALAIAPGHPQAAAELQALRTGRG